MKFTALPVRVGDAFLLRSPVGTVLIDAGQNKRHILKLLGQEHLSKNHINLLVCTHYDADHIKGILGILESHKYSFDEIWLPEVLGSLSYTISETLMPILKRLRELDSEGIANLIREARNSSKPEPNFSILEDPPIKTANLDTLKNLLALSLRSEPPFMWMVYPWYSLCHSALPVQAMLANLSAAIITVSSALSSGAHVRWFKYSQSLVGASYGFGMSAMNSAETAVTLYSPDVFFQQLYLTTINVESLVFKFSCQQHPDVLFCADSNLSFTSKPIQLKKQSIVTAPHHGSASADAAYCLIRGSDLICVRSDQSQTKRPGNGFLSMDRRRRYCTICRNMGPPQKVVISYAGNSPRVHGKKCKC
jgi:hypothetical protein